MKAFYVILDNIQLSFEIYAENKEKALEIAKNKVNANHRYPHLVEVVEI